MASEGGYVTLLAPQKLAQLTVTGIQKKTKLIRLLLRYYIIAISFT